MAQGEQARARYLYAINLHIFTLSMNFNVCFNAKNSFALSKIIPLNSIKLDCYRCGCTLTLVNME